MPAATPSAPDALRANPALRLLPAEDLARVEAELIELVLAPGAVAVSEGETTTDLYFVLEGAAAVERHGLALRPLAPGDHFGELALLGSPARAATVTATAPLRLARLTRARFDALAAAHPRTALRLVEGLAHVLADNWVSMTDRVGLLLGERLLPRRTEVRVTVAGEIRLAATGTRVGDLLPPDVDGDPVVAALLDDRPVSLDTAIGADAWLAPVRLGSWEGREVVQRSAGLLLLAAADHTHPEWQVRLGPALTTFQRVEHAAPASPEAVVLALGPTLRRLIEERVAFREEIWTVEEARAALARGGWDAAAAVLDAWRDGAVTLVRCEGALAVRTGPVLPDARLLDGVALRVHGDDVVLDLGARGAAGLGDAPVGEAERAIEARAPRFGGAMVKEAARWRARLGITSVGELNRACVAGRVDEIIRVAEGFHEKRIGQLADAIAARGDRLRVITIAGPSSSGKTTFIKRLITQLQVAGMSPHAVSLDDYYVDRARTPRDALGELDYEALEALDLAALGRDVRALLAGAEVRPPRYDFKAGVSLAGAGAPLALGAGDILLLEGIHGLNPRLLGDAVPADALFRVFLHPASSLPLDRLGRVAPEDLRLLRRIVRDRHGRAIRAADNIARWPSVRRGELVHIFPYLPHADATFDSALVYELCVLKVYAERYLLEVPPRHASNTVAQRLRQLVDRFVAIYPEHVPPTSILREFIGGSGFEY